MPHLCACELSPFLLVMFLGTSPGLSLDSVDALLLDEVLVTSSISSADKLS